MMGHGQNLIEGTGAHQCQTVNIADTGRVSLSARTHHWLSISETFTPDLGIVLTPPLSERKEKRANALVRNDNYTITIMQY